MRSNNFGYVHFYLKVKIMFYRYVKTHRYIQCRHHQVQLQVLRHEGMFASVHSDDVTSVQAIVCGRGGV